MFRKNINFNLLSNENKINIIGVDGEYSDKMSEKEFFSLFKRVPHSTKLSFLLKNKKFITPLFVNNIMGKRLKKDLVNYLQIDENDTEDVIESIYILANDVELFATKCELHKLYTKI